MILLSRRGQPASATADLHGCDLHRAALDPPRQPQHDRAPWEMRRGDDRLPGSLSCILL
jgi:hypothetical protein